MCDLTIKGVPIRFPFEPYEIQKTYMEKVIDCLQNQCNGVLESPTGTGKTLSLLCASLAWLQLKKAQVQAQRTMAFENEANDFMKSLQSELNAAGKSSNVRSGRSFLGLPTIIYASRTHSQLSQAMQELKRTAYSHMKACVLGSREQLCIHPEVTKEKDTTLKIHLCRLKTKTKSCQFNNRVERMKDDSVIRDLNVIDIEDIVKLGQTHKFCPYYMAKELKQQADIVFMPYNYLIDPKVRKVLGVDVQNNIIILDEAHNVEKMCEDSASLQIKSTDITLCIEEVTAVMRLISDDSLAQMQTDEPKDFTPEDLCILKQMLLDFEKALDEIEIKGPASEGVSFDGDYIFDLLKAASIDTSNHHGVTNLIEKIVQFLATVSGEGPFQRKGNSLQLFADLLMIAFAGSSSDFKEKIKKCYKVHIRVEEPKKKSASNWLSKATLKSGCRVLSYWCFSPGFGMKMLLEKDLRCVILTSGTLAPLKPLISELELNVQVSLENPHIVSDNQICVRIVTKGPDGEVLNCNYQNRDNPKYINSVGRTILNLIRVIPNGLLIFFPSYPIMQKFKDTWQESGIWDNICEQKQIYVEPKDKVAFNNVMGEYYTKIRDCNFKGAIFMGVCRGKVSEGVDFADINGRAVVVIGLPFPPLKDPRVVLKKCYLNACNARDKEYLRGDDWYSLEATRAVNQAIGRVIRHKDDFGAILLLDSRFANSYTQSRLSLWIRGRVKTVDNFGQLISDLRRFFKNAESKLPSPKLKSSNSSTPAQLDKGQVQVHRKGNFDFSTSSIDTSGASTSSESLNPNGMVTLHNISSAVTKKRKITLIPNPSIKRSSVPETATKEYIVMVKKTLDESCFKAFLRAMQLYRDTLNFDEMSKLLDEIFLTRPHLRYVIQGLEPYIKSADKGKFSAYWDIMRLT